ncbi:MAG: GBS Bsp-like repeat-containing protein [Clostridiales Family XIII bacterium]|nr:GBS Bsp-like repeat-containing protein [Clostridiales Family XIII bacterium]
MKRHCTNGLRKVVALLLTVCMVSSLLMIPSLGDVTPDAIETIEEDFTTPEAITTPEDVVTPEAVMIPEEAVPEEIIVVMKDNISEEQIVESVEVQDEILEVESLNNDEKIVVIETSGDVNETVAEYNDNPNVEYAQPNYQYTMLADTNDSYFKDQWALQKKFVTKVNEAWGVIPMPSTKVRVAVLDTGVDVNHPDLVGSVNAALAYNVKDSSSNVKDPYIVGDDERVGHGTHVAGIIAASANNSLGVAGVSGNRAEIVPIKVFYEYKGMFTSDTSMLIKAYNKVLSSKCKVVNMSVGIYDYYDQALYDAIQNARNKGVVTVAAGGNYNTSSACYPSDFDNVISVVATDKSNNKASFSDHNSYKDIAAPGVDILSTLPTVSNPAAPYGYESGTSMSAPYVSGVIALLFSLSPNLTPTKIEQYLYSTATDRGAAGRDNNYGYGIVNALSAARMISCSMSTGSVNIAAGTFQANVATGSLTGVKEVEVAIWCDKNQSDIKWYTATNQGSGKYRVNANISNHKYHYGTYQAHTYITMNNGVKFNLATASVKFAEPKAAISATLNSTQKMISITADNIIKQPSAKKVEFAVWGSKDGQNDLKWYTATKASNGKYTLNVPVSKHKEIGAYSIHVYVTNTAGASYYAGATSVKVAGPSATVKAQSINSAKGTFQIKVSGLKVPSGVSTVQIPTWCSSDQSDIVWYKATKQKDGTFLVKTSVSKHKNHYGTYKSHVYIQAANGTYGIAGTTSYSVKAPVVKMVASLDSAHKKISVTASNVLKLPAAKQVEFAVWGNPSGQNDIRWYKATKTSNGTYKFTVPVSNHKEKGIYNIHAYATHPTNGSKYFVGSITVKV